MASKRAGQLTWHLGRFAQDKGFQGVNRVRRVVERGHSEQSSMPPPIASPFYVFKLPKLSPIMQSAR